MTFDNYVVKGLKALQSHHLHLANTFATVVSVENKGLYVNVTLDLYTVGQTQLSNIPVIKNPYLNLPIREGDKVFLVTANHLQNDYFLTGSFIDNIPQDSYLAIPIVLQTFYANTVNDWVYYNPEKTYKEIINETSHIVEASEVEQTISLKNSTQEYKENLQIQSKSEIKLNADSQVAMESSSIKVLGDNIRQEGSSIEVNASSNLTLNSSTIDLGDDSAKLGSLLSELISALVSAQTELAGGPSPHIHKSIDSITSARLQLIASKITSVFV